MRKYSSLRLCIVLTSILFIISACTLQLSGKAKKDSTWSVETRHLEKEAAAYTGPQYTIGIVPFDNKVPAKVSGVGEAVTTLLASQLDAAGLDAAPVDDKAPVEMGAAKAPQRPGTLNIRETPGNNGLDTLDFRLSGTISSYSEVDEWMDATATKKISIVARVTMDYVLIESNTGKQLMAESVSGEFRRPPTGASEPAARASFDPNLRDGALRNALAKVSVTLTRRLGSLPFQGKLLAVDGASLVLRAGLRSRLKEGTQLVAYRLSKSIVDPDTGQVLGYRESKVGTIQISKHLNENLSLATAVSGSRFQAGDIVKPMP